MNISKFTQKSLQAVQDLEKTAYDFRQPGNRAGASAAGYAAAGKRPDPEADHWYGHRSELFYE